MKQHAIVKRIVVCDPKDPNHKYLEQESVLCRKNNDNNCIYYGNLDDPNVMYFDKVKDGNTFIRDYLNRDEYITSVNHRKCNIHACIPTYSIILGTRYRRNIDKYLDLSDPTKPILNPYNQSIIYKHIVIKDKNTNLYIFVPQFGDCKLVKKENCTLFSNSNDSRYIVSNIRARSFMSCYHDMDLIEVDLNDHPIIRKKTGQPPRRRK